MSEAQEAGEVRAQKPVREVQGNVGLAELPRILPLEEAARELQMPVEHLTDLVQSGRVPAYLAPDGKSMMVPVPLPEQPQALQPATDGNGEVKRPLTLEEINARLAAVKREDFAHLEAKGISVREAVEKYGIPRSTLLHWTRRGYVRVLRRGTSKTNPTLLNEADVAFCSVVRKIREEAGVQFGAPILDSEGQPHLLKRPLSLLISKAE